MARDGPQPESRTFICPRCDKPVAAQVKGTAAWNGRNRDGESVELPNEWALLQCPNCMLPIVQLREDFGAGFGADEPVVVFPTPHRISSLVPGALQREWSEARTCFDAKAYTACVVMVRRTLEGTCKEHGITKPNLRTSLRELEKQGLIDGTLAKWADALRVIGNKGAHYTGQPVSRDDAEDSLAFAEALLDHLYVLRKRFEAFRQRLDEKQRE